eukprot:8235207-Karenia_brevis.AAC.1
MLNGCEQKLDPPPPPPYQPGVAPTQPNVFSDGAFTHPTTPMYGLSTGGIWHPSRQLDVIPLSSLELDYSLHKQCHDGLEMFMYLDGVQSFCAIKASCTHRLSFCQRACSRCA